MATTGPATGAHIPGTLHSGGVIPGTVHQNPTREFGDRGMAQQGPSTHTHSEHNRVSNTHDSTFEQERSVKEVPVPGRFLGRFSINKGAHSLLLLTTLLTLASFLVALGGLAAVQHHFHNLRVVGTQIPLYNAVFQGGQQVSYPGQSSRQFAFSWYILAMEIFVTLMVLFLLCVPRRLLRLKHVAMALLVYVFVLSTLQVESLLYFRRTSSALFGRHLILITLIGWIAGTICNGLSIILLGLLRNKHEIDDYHNYPRRGKRVGADTQSGAWGPGAGDDVGYGDRAATTGGGAGYGDGAATTGGGAGYGNSAATTGPAAV